MTAHRGRSWRDRTTIPALLAAVAWLTTSVGGPPGAAALAVPLAAIPDSYSVRHDRTLNVAAPGVLDNDQGLNVLGQPTAVRDSWPLHGSLTLMADGSFSYTPDAGYEGQDGFDYHMSDGLLPILRSNSTTVTIRVTSSPAPTPTPTPTPMLPLPTLPLPTIPLPTLPLPTLPPVPTLPPLPTLLPTLAPPPTSPLPTLPLPTLPPILPGVTPSPGPTSAVPTAGPNASPSASVDASTPPGSAAPGSTTSPGGQGPGQLPPVQGGFAVGGTAGDGEAGGPVGGIGGLVAGALGALPGGLLAWSYPALLMTVPGLLLLLVIGAQALGAFAWLPIVRRRLGGFGATRRLDGAGNGRLP